MIAATLTYAQAETLYDLTSYWRNEIPFTPQEAFPSRNNADNGKRRCCRKLAEKGLLTPTPGMTGYYTPDRHACEAAWLAWREKNLDWEGRF